VDANAGILWLINGVFFDEDVFVELVLELVFVAASNCFFTAPTMADEKRNAMRKAVSIMKINGNFLIGNLRVKCVHIQT
jgi:hypothetical protein